MDFPCRFPFQFPLGWVSQTRCAAGACTCVAKTPPPKLWTEILELLFVRVFEGSRPTFGARTFGGFCKKHGVSHGLILTYSNKNRIVWGNFGL